MEEIFQSDNPLINLDSTSFNSSKLSKNKNSNDLSNEFENMIEYYKIKINDINSRYQESNKLKWFESNNDKKTILNLIYYKNENNSEEERKNKTIKNNKLRIFGKTFVNKNKNKGKCEIIYKNKQFELKEYLEDIDKNYNKNLIKLKLKINNILIIPIR